jgi:hypothetical protein
MVLSGSQEKKKTTSMDMRIRLRRRLRHRSACRLYIEKKTLVFFKMFWELTNTPHPVKKIHYLPHTDGGKERKLRKGSSQRKFID